MFRTCWIQVLWRQVTEMSEEEENPWGDLDCEGEQIQLGEAPGDVHMGNEEIVKVKIQENLLKQRKKSYKVKLNKCINVRDRERKT